MDLGFTFLILVIVGILIFIGVAWWKTGKIPGGGGGGGGGGKGGVSVPIVSEYYSNNAVVAQSFPNSKFPRSTDQPTGIEFTYALWMSVHDWNASPKMCLCNLKTDGTCPAGCEYKPSADAREGIVFIKGVPRGVADSTSDTLPPGTSQCPALTIRENTDIQTKNVLNFYMDTYSRSGPEKVTIYNLPTSADSEHPTFFHVALVVTENKMRVYLNGNLTQTKVLDFVPAQNDNQLFIAPRGGLDGYQGELGNFCYFNYALTDNEVADLLKDPPNYKVTSSSTYKTTVDWSMNNQA